MPRSSLLRAHQIAVCCASTEEFNVGLALCRTYLRSKTLYCIVRAGLVELLPSWPLFRKGPGRHGDLPLYPFVRMRTQEEE